MSRGLSMVKRATLESLRERAQHGAGLPAVSGAALRDAGLVLELRSRPGWFIISAKGVEALER